MVTELRAKIAAEDPNAFDDHEYEQLYKERNELIQLSNRVAKWRENVC